MWMKPAWRFPVSKPDLRGNEEKYAVEAIRSSWISSTGPFIDTFERAFANYCGVPHAVSTCNGTAALHLALMALDVRPGDEVIVPALTYVAVANAVRYVGAEPVFVDVDADTWCLDPSEIERKITRRTRGVIAVHTYGHPADMAVINRLAGVHGLWVIEDAAEAHSAKIGMRPVGSMGRLAVFSFYGNKILSGGEGGAVVTSDPQLDIRLRTLRGQGVDPARRYYFPVTGYNFRMTNVTAAILCAQMERVVELVRERNRVCQKYLNKLTGWPSLRQMRRAPWATVAPWFYCVVTPARDALERALESHGIETRPFFVPLHHLPPFREKSAGEHFPVTGRLAAQGLSLPTYPELSDDDVDFICARVLEVLENGRRSD